MIATAEPDRRAAIARLLYPQSVCIVGASDKPMSIGANVLANFEAFGFAGALHLVSRSRDSIGGRDCLKSLDDLPYGVDAVVLVVPVAAVRESVEACARRGVGGVVVFASGFAELGDLGRAEQDAIAAIAEDAGMALLGPNCLGMTCFPARAPLTFERVQPHDRTGRGIAIVAQSGAMTGNIRQALVSRGLPVSHAISTGNEAALSAVDLLSVLVDDDAISTFAMFVEQIRDPGAFLRFADRAWDLGKPVVLMHPGRSERSREAAKSHTGAMAGDYALMATMAAEFGVSVVESFDELFDTVTLRHRYPHARLEGLGVMTNSGAVRGFALDFCEDLELSLPTLGEASTEGLTAVLPDFAGVDNPLDITAQGMSQPSLFGDTAALMLADESVDGLLVAAMGGNPAQVMAKWGSLKPVLSKAEKPVALCFLGDAVPLSDAFMAEVADSGIPFFRSPERALRAFAHLGRIHRSEGLTPPATECVRRPSEPVMLAEYRGKEILRRAGLAVPEGRLARDLDAAKGIAEKIGYPVALKVQAASIPHKSDIGGVKIGLRDNADLAEAWTDVAVSVAEHRRDAVIDGMLVERMATPFDLELVLSARRDPDWGVVVIFGLGGVWTELFADVRMLPAGLPRQRYAAELATLKGFPLLDGYRGKPRLDVDAVLDAIAALGNRLLDDPRVAEIEVNPLAVYARGGGVLALDALVSVWEEA